MSQCADHLLRRARRAAGAQAWASRPGQRRGRASDAEEWRLLESLVCCNDLGNVFGRTNDPATRTGRSPLGAMVRRASLFAQPPKTKTAAGKLAGSGGAGPACAPRETPRPRPARARRAAPRNAANPHAPSGAARPAPRL